MKIGVITYWQSYDNYGQILQAWALQQYLIDLGHEAFIIRYDFDNRPYPTLLWKKILRIILFPLYYQRVVARKKNRESFIRFNKERQFDEFRESELYFSKKIYSKRSQLCNDYPIADCYIVGSDQVWARLVNYKENLVFFLKFGPKSIKRISYAASFGFDSYPKELENDLRNALKDFDAISCREYSGVSICNSININATKVLDPTLLFDYRKYLDLYKGYTNNFGSYIFIYSLNVSSPEDIGWKQLKKVANEKGLKIIVVTATGYINANEELFKDVIYIKASIKEWLSLIANAELIVTPSFHGIVFSIIFKKNFIFTPVVGKYSKGNDRITDLLSDLNLSKRIFKENNIENIFLDSINWPIVDKCLLKQKIQSESFLKENL